MKIKITIKSIFGKVLFECEKENNTIKDALEEAYLSGANLSRAYLSGADLSGADLNKFKYLFQIIPMEGSFIAWKKLANNCLAKIEIPSKSPRTFSVIGRKCRAKYVKTLKIWNETGKEIKEMNGTHDCYTLYKVNRLTYSDKWDNNPLIECTYGIHFFISKQEAINW